MFYLTIVGDYNRDYNRDFHLFERDRKKVGMVFCSMFMINSYREHVELHHLPLDTFVNNYALWFQRKRLNRIYKINKIFDTNEMLDRMIAEHQHRKISEALATHSTTADKATKRRM